MAQSSNGNSTGTHDLSAFDGVDFSEAEHRNLIIIGSGPAGFTAALYSARANLEPLLFQGPEAGGQLITTTDVENYPGFPEGVMGPDMMMKFEEQAKRFGTDVRYGTVTSVDFSQRPFRLLVDAKKPFLADTVVVSTGASARYLGLENEKRLLGHGVSACATCDGSFFRDLELALVGGGDTAMEEALFLTRFATKVRVLPANRFFRRSETNGLAEVKTTVLKRSSAHSWVARGDGLSQTMRSRRNSNCSRKSAVRSRTSRKRSKCR